MAKKTNKPKLVKHRTNKSGLPPGSLVHVGEKKIDSVRISIIDYDSQTLQEKQCDKIEECFACKQTPTVTWINIDGLHEVNVIENLGMHFGIHTLVLEDILSTDQRPKQEDYDTHLFVVLKMLTYDEQQQCVRSEQISIILGSNYVLSFQEAVGDVFEPIRARLRQNKGKIRKMGADYLLYALLDAIVDSYFLILEKIGDHIEILEDELVNDPDDQTLRQIHELKREMIFLRRNIWPLRELISGLERCESDLIQDQVELYLRDVYDHSIQVIDTVESLRDMVTGMLDIYLSSISNKMNAVMKVLTIIATLFIPTTFVAGIYGMNFDHMPELHWKYGYVALWGVLLTIFIVMIVYFKKKKWL